jgi:hypothetical protein
LTHPKASRTIGIEPITVKAMTSPARALAAALAMVFLGGTLAVVSTQTLADVAKKEEDRRKSIKEAGKTYTNSDLHSVPPATATGAGSTEPAKTGSSAPADGDKKKDTDKDKDKDKDPAKDKTYWSGRMKELQAQLERDQTYADALQSRINQLTTDFVGRDDPAQRSVIARDKQKAIDELNLLKQTIVADKKAMSDLEDEARRAGVPPGWLRS